MGHKTRLLSTMPLAQPLLDKAVELGVVLDVMSFIKISAVEDAAMEEKIVDLCYLPITAVFTSANAVKAVADIIINADPGWDIYCIGNATLAAVKKVFESAIVKGVANDAAALAKVIISQTDDEIVLFCGDKRLDTLPDALRENDIDVFEVVVYQTTETPKEVSPDYDGILFFSPSAVNSFFSANKIGPDTVLFAIGNTTANATKPHTFNKVIVSETASKETVLDYAAKYFTNKPA